MRYILQILRIYANLVKQPPALLYLTKAPFSPVLFEAFSYRAVLVEYPSYGLVATGQIMLTLKLPAAFEWKLPSQGNDFHLQNR
jgi:hypothetical protein